MDKYRQYEVIQVYHTFLIKDIDFKIKLTMLRNIRNINHIRILSSRQLFSLLY